jgi:hypothetical protein
MMAQMISPEMADAWMLRGWGQHDANRLAIAIAWGKYSEDDACRELATTLAWHATRAKIHTVSCRVLAAEMLEDAIGAVEHRHNAVQHRMTAAAEAVLRADPRDRMGAAMAAAGIARAEEVPPHLIHTALRHASWRTGRRA